MAAVNCPYCKSLLAMTPLGYLCMAKSNDGHVCGTTIGDPEQVRKPKADGTL